MPIAYCLLLVAYPTTSPHVAAPTAEKAFAVDAHNTSPPNGNDLEQRLVDFAVAVIHLVDRLDRSLGGRHVAGQVVRSGTSAAPNYAEARSAESRDDFIHKVRIATKELNETSVWLQIIVRSGLAPPGDVSATIEECEALRRILGASLRTARRNARGHNDSGLRGPEPVNGQ